MYDKMILSTENIELYIKKKMCMIIIIYELKYFSTFNLT